ncbi:FAD-dependent catabolic D-arginine dehydrogenase DauA [Usitatibacter rugosus]|uniref:FAD-dependent catabolic D-arginine dehydrogenase DauA n=1 Tax=Usitatibacter rugosus TaxID=2732067 RepID=A0A6M4GSZ4_9PROT|nr:FAD-binding oxidoreductase [Usitatibacter rugosus]QJR10361.1 FAD-dependent catabolic D-arginine dehydrogenase DauA [Usitatibacter rugosus]
MPQSHPVDFVVVGAGIAGASVASALASRGSVAVLDMEEHAGYHSTGRSAALYSAIYGNATIRALTRASREFLFEPSADFSSVPLVSPRQTLYFAREDQMASLERMRSDDDVKAGTELVDAVRAASLVPIFKPGYVHAAALDAGSADIDVDALHQAYLRRTRSLGGRIELGAAVREARWTGDLWSIATRQDTFTAPVVVNCAGAWGDEFARLAGVRPIGLQPRRRTAMRIEAPTGAELSPWPAAVDVDEEFYFKPDAGALLLSPADEHESPACDVQPEELDVAIAVDRFERATSLRVERVTRRWAGLRVFTSDRTPALGFDDEARGFFWLVGQGGYGIQTSPALGRIAAALACGEAPPIDEKTLGVRYDALAMDRFRH